MAKRPRSDDGSIERAESLHGRIVEVFGKHDLAALTSIESWIPSLPDPVDPLQSYNYMGRSVTGEIRQFILFIGQLFGFEDLREDKSQVYHVQDGRVMGFVFGVPGFGKSTSLKAAFGNLYHSFLPKNLLGKYVDRLSKSLKDGQVAPADRQRIEEAVGKAINWLNSSDELDFEDKLKELEGVCNSGGASLRKRKRIMYMKGEDFVAEPTDAMLASLLLSHFDMVQAEDPKLLGLLDRPTVDGIVDFLGRGEEVYVLVDDGNVMDVQDDEQSSHSRRRKFSLEERRAAQNVLRKLRKHCAVIVCASVKSWIIQSVLTDKGLPFKFYGGGFTMSERSAYLKHRGIILSRRDEDVTGCVPRLVAFLDSREQLQQSYEWYQEGIRAFVAEQIGRGNGHELYRVFSGREQVHRFFDGLKTRCFYRGPKGTAECLTNHLKSYALGCVAEQMKLQASADGKQEMQRWLSRVSWDTNMCRIGWSAEAAGIIALSLTDVAINLGLSHNPVQAEVSVPEAGMRHVLKELMQDAFIWVFVKPVDVHLNPDYPGVITKPMDLGTVQRKLNTGQYASSSDAFAKDVDLVFDNALRYNKKGDRIHSAAGRLKDKFRKLWHKTKEILEIRPDVVRHFGGLFSCAPWDGKKVLHVPHDFNHTGADVYYEDEKTIVVIQLSVAVNAKEKHTRTVELMSRIPCTEKRRRILLWVLAGVHWAYEKVEDGQCCYEDIVIPFVDLHPELGCVDSRCATLRMAPGEECLYCCAPDCPEGAGGPDNVDDWVQCAKCELWVHKLCVKDERQEGSLFVCRDCL